MQQTKIFSVTEITHTIKLLLEENIPTIWIEGEVSNFKAHYSGHYYFTLKDSSAQISAVMWRSRATNLDFDLEDGMKIQALGQIRLYEKSGRYQIDIIKMQPAGVGLLQLEFEELKQKLQQEGLFEKDHKKDLPSFPGTVGVITSGTGAAVRDIINVIQRRAPHVQIIISPVKVQGDGAAKEISEAIETFNRFNQVDLLIVGRGGGSLEDLWAFNEEIVARAIYNSNIPIVSAVGHEVDFTISDFVADLRAPTPSAAAELSVPDYYEVRDRIMYSKEWLSKYLLDDIHRKRDQIDSIKNSYGMRKLDDQLKQNALQIDELSTKLEQFFMNKLARTSELVSQLEKRLVNLNPKQVLKRGYSITYKEDSVVFAAEQVNKADQITTEFAGFKVESQVINISKENSDAKS